MLAHSKSTRIWFQTSSSYTLTSQNNNSTGATNDATYHYVQSPTQVNSQSLKIYQVFKSLSNSSSVTRNPGMLIGELPCLLTKQVCKTSGVALLRSPQKETVEPGLGNRDIPNPLTEMFSVFFYMLHFQVSFLGEKIQERPTFRAQEVLWQCYWHIWVFFFFLIILHVNGCSIFS